MNPSTPEQQPAGNNTPRGKRPLKYAEKALTYVAGAAWTVFDKLNHIKPAASFTPRWSDKPLLKSWEKEKPPLGWPRETDSLCPVCVPQIRDEILEAEDYSILLNQKPGEIKAKIIERDGKIWMIKECSKHGKFEDVMSIDPEFSNHLEKVFPGRDIKAHNDEGLHNHGSSSVTHGRGSVLTIDLTNRCNMMCDPCFMDANQVGFVHELQWSDIKTLLDNAISIKPKPDIRAVLAHRSCHRMKHLHVFRVWIVAWERVIECCIQRDHLAAHCLEHLGSKGTRRTIAASDYNLKPPREFRPVSKRCDIPLRHIRDMDVSSRTACLEGTSQHNVLEC